LNDLASIITDLEQRRQAIESALTALREIGGTGFDEAVKSGGRNARSEGQRRRWAEKQAAEAASQKAPRATSKKRKLTAAGRKRLSELMKARWASRNPPKKKVRGDLK
jgi:hypothetical protein